MQMIWEAIRAVTVEVMGVGAVIFMLFSAAGWTVESAGVQPQHEVERAWEWVQATTDHVTASIKPKLTVEQRQRFAAERLDYYGQLYGDTAGSDTSPTARQLMPAVRSPAPRVNQLLGTL